MSIETIVLQVTTKCPFNCPQCYMQRGLEDMDLDVAKSIIDWACEMNVQMVQITGGEPLVYSHLKQLISYCNAKGLLTTLATSGYNCTHTEICELINHGLSALCVSLNGAKKKTDASSRESYDYALRTLEEIHLFEIPRFLNFVVTKTNFSELEDLIQLAQKYDVCKICILKPFGKHLKEQRLNKDELWQLNQIVNRELDYLLVENCYLEYWSLVNNKDCRCSDAAQTSFFFRCDGKVQPCSKCKDVVFDSVDELVQNFSFNKKCFVNE